MKFSKSKKSQSILKFPVISKNQSNTTNLAGISHSSPLMMMFIPVSNIPNTASFSSSCTINTALGSTTSTTHNLSLPNMSISVNQRSFKPHFQAPYSPPTNSMPSANFYSPHLYQPQQTDSNSMYSSSFDEPYSSSVPQAIPWMPQNSLPLPPPPPPQPPVRQLSEIVSANPVQEMVIEDDENLEVIKQGQMSEVVFGIDENDELDFNESVNSESSHEQNLPEKAPSTRAKEKPKFTKLKHLIGFYRRKE